MTSSPPYLRGEHVGRLLHSAYNAWSEHHRGCAHCQQQDWYMPGEFREVTKPPADIKMEIEHEDGSTQIRLFIRAPDTSVLCREGGIFFRTWEHQAMQQETVYTRRGEA